MTRYFQLVIPALLGLLFILCNPTNPNQQKNSTAPLADPIKECISRVIALDDSLGTIRNHACEKISLSKTIEGYVQEMRKIDYQDCPQAFAKAFQRHQQAWMDMIVVTDNYPDLRGELHDLFDIIEKGKDKEAFKSYLKAIWDTWKEVEQAKGE